MTVQLVACTPLTTGGSGASGRRTVKQAENSDFASVSHLHHIYLPLIKNNDKLNITGVRYENAILNNKNLYSEFRK